MVSVVLLLRAGYMVAIYDLHDIVEEISEKNDEKSDGTEEYAY